MNVLRRLIADAMARDLCAFVVPGPDVARARGLDLAGAGLHLAPTPRHANVLLIAGPLPPGLRDAATVAYAQMPRPRAILALGAGDTAPLPPPDATADLSQAGLAEGVAAIGRAFATGAFGENIVDFNPPALQTRIQYTCPMHPEVISDEPGNCPKCGMTLTPRETAASGHTGHAMSRDDSAMPAQKPAASMAASHDHSQHTAVEAPAQYTCPMHPEVISDEPGSCPKCGMFLVAVKEKSETDSGHHHHSQHTAVEAPAQYTCPMHPEVISDEPGSCPKCGMSLVAVKEKSETDSDHDRGGHAGHEDHAGHAGHAGGETIDGIEPHFMSMVDLTSDMPASADGLKMEWIEVPFGPFFPGLPSGLELTLTLDGDAVAEARVQSLVGGVIAADGMTPQEFVDHFAEYSPLSPVANRQLACLSLASAAGITSDAMSAMACAAAVERERIASHLGWLASFAAQTGLVWMERRAAALQRSVRAASVDQIAAITASLRGFLHRVRKTPLLRAKLSGNGRIGEGKPVVGPVARAQGIESDARADDPVYAALGFQIRTGAGDDALARFYQRCDEIGQSLELIARAKEFAVPTPDAIGTVSGQGKATVETPRGAARLTVELLDGKLVAASCQPPSAAHMDLLPALVVSHEIADALVSVGSLDLSPWGLPV